MKTAQELSNSIESWFKQVDKVVIALSGGIDSSLVTYIARKVLGKDKVVAVISASASLKRKDLTEARQFAEKYDINLVEILTREMEDPNYNQNPINRCFFCKTALYTELKQLILDKYSDYSILNGNNYSDNQDYRPGLEAAEQFQVLSPLAECKFTKKDIRVLARYYDLPNWDKPASPCLSSRFPYGENITEQKLSMVEKAESVLLKYGFDDARVRYINEGARLEVPVHEVNNLQSLFGVIMPQVRSLGFKHCEIDQEGLVSGKLNRDINK